MFEPQLLEYYLYASLPVMATSLYFNYSLQKKLKERAKSDAVLIKNAYYNPITELPNRKNIDIVLSEQIDRAFRHRQTFLLTAVRIKNYHDVSLHSKELGEAFILEASERILKSIRTEDVLAHISDDSFIIMFNEYLDEDNYDIIIERIEKAFEEKSDIDTKYNIKYEIAIGHSKYPNNGTDGDMLIDKAMKEASKF